MSRFPALKAAAFLDAFLPFFLGEFFNPDGVDIHGIVMNEHFSFFYLSITIKGLSKKRHGTWSQDLE